MGWTSPRTWVAGEKPPAATLNTHIRDNFKAIGDPWTAYTPAWTAATTNPVLGNGTLVGAYMQAGKFTSFWVLLTMGSTTTFGSGAYFLTTPFAPVNQRWLFQGIARDASASASFPAFAEYDATLPLRLRALPTTAGNALSSISPTVPFTWAQSDTLLIHGTYEAA